MILCYTVVGIVFAGVVILVISIATINGLCTASIFSVVSQKSTCSRPNKAQPP